jgi:hypothetical protein
MMATMVAHAGASPSLLLLGAVLAGCGRVGFETADCQATALASAPYAGGAGTQDDPYRLCSPAQLIALANRPEDLAAHFVVKLDLDLAGSPFPGIGHRDAPFTGSFDGGGHTISNVTVTASPDEPAGFVRSALGARIDDLRLADVTVAGANYVGAVVGTCERSQVRGAAVTTASVRGEVAVGGLVGHAFECLVLDASFEGSVEGTVRAIGGMVGDSGRSSFVAIDVIADVIAPTGTGIGGVLGTDSIDPTIVQNVTARGSVAGDRYVGGILGMNADGAYLLRSRFEGTVHGNQGVGGVVGMNADIPFEVASTEVIASVMGNDGVGGFSGYMYYTARFVDSSFAGTLTGIGADQDAFGGFFGYVAWDRCRIERSYVDVTIDSRARRAGGVIGFIYDWGPPDRSDIVDSFSAAHVTGESATDTVSPWLGETTATEPFVGLGSYYWSGGSCTNLGAGECGSGGSAIAELTSAQALAAPPLSAWDFVHVWQPRSDAFPTLRSKQLHAPAASHACPREAIAGVPYVCEVAVTDADPNEARFASFERAHSCWWLASAMGGRQPVPRGDLQDPLLVGTPEIADEGTCTIALGVTDGAHTTRLDPLLVNVHAGVAIAPTTWNRHALRYGASFGLAQVGTTVTLEFTLTNHESGFANVSLTGLPAGDFAFAGGAYPGVGGTCATSIEPGATCTVTIAFTPTGTSSRESPLSIHFEAARGPVSYVLVLGGFGYL